MDAKTCELPSLSMIIDGTLQSVRQDFESGCANFETGCAGVKCS